MGGLPPLVKAVLLFILSGCLGAGEGKIAKIYYVTFITIALVISVSTDFFREITCDL